MTFYSKIIFFGLVLTIVTAGGIMAQSIQGNFSVTVNQVTTYSYDNGTFIIGAVWDASTGTVANPRRIGTTYYADITWTTVGPGTLTFSDRDGVLDTEIVGVASCATNPTITSSLARCGPGTLTLTATPGSGGNTVRWYTVASGGTATEGTSYVTPSQSSSGGSIYYTTYNTSNGCESSPRVQAILTINTVPAAPSVNPGPSICGSGSITVSGSAASGTVVWYSNNSSGTISSGALGTGNSYTTTISNSTTFYAGSYLSNASGGCETAPGSRVSVTAVVNTIPTLSATGNNQTVCSGLGGASITLSNPNNVTGTTYSWTVTQNDAGGASNVSNTTYNNVGYVLFATSNTLGSVNFAFTASANGCTSGITNILVNVSPTPTLSVSNDAATICSGQYSNISLSNPNGIAGTNYSWSVSPSNVNGASAVTNTSAQAITQALTSANGSTSGTITYGITASANGCSSGTTNATVTVKPTPTLSVTNNSASLCSGQSTSIALSNPNGVSGTLYSWSVTPSNVSGSSAASNTASASIAQALTSTNGITSGTVTYGISASANGCASSTTNTNVAVNPIPNVTPSLSSQTTCSGGAMTAISLSSNVGGTSFSWTATPSNGTYLSGYSNGSGSSISQTLSNSGTVAYAVTYAITPTAAGCTGSNGSASVSVNPRPTASASNQTMYVGGSSSVALSSNVSGTTFSFAPTNILNVSNATSGNGSTIAQALSVTDNINTGTVTYVITPAAAGCTGNTVNSVVSVYPVPVTMVNGVVSSSSATYYNNYGYPITLSAKTFYSSYQWYKDGTAVSGETNTTYSPLAAGVYTVQAVAPGATQSSTSAATNVSSPNVNSEVNSLSRTVFYKSGLDGTSSPYSLQPSELNRSIIFSDGLGRAIQTVGVAQSPNGDIVVPMVPGKSGLTDSTFLPYATSSVQGNFHGKAVRGSTSWNSYTTSEQYQFYQNTPKVASDAKPYARAIFRNTPDARIVEQGAPGADWQPGTTHTVSNLMALATSSTFPVLFWNANGTTSGYYADNTVWVTTITDENGHVVNVYKNKLGQTVLKQVQADASTWLLTYYVYDTYGQLVYQIPPKAMTVLGNGTSLDANTASVAELIYQYKYDSVGNVIEKKVPGSAAQWIVYDKLGRVVLTQDGNQRSQGVWAFVKYDFKNRPVYAGLYTSASNRTTLQKYFYNNINYSSQPWFESRAVNATYQGYTNTVYPTTNLQLLTVTYFDDYDFDSNGTADYSYDNAHLAGMPASASTTTRGLATGTRKLILGTSNWLTTAVFYDKLDRTIQTLSNNHLNLNMNDKVSVLYFANNLSGKVQKIKTTHTAAATVTITQRYTYDNSWRAVGVYQSIDNSPNEQLVALYKYNALGQRVEKNLHLLYDAQDGQTGTLTNDDLVESQYNGENQLIARNSIKLLPGYNVKTDWKAALTTVTQAQAEANGRYLQSVDMRYNIRGWLTSINNAQLTSDNNATNDDTNDYFGMELAYNTDAGIGNTVKYNGNITAVKWKGPGASLATGTKDQRSFKYTYDFSDRLMTTTFAANSGSAWDKEAGTLDESMTYDANGNILALTRKQNQRTWTSGITVTSSAQLIDNLTYTYTGNQLGKVEDATGDATGFKNGVNTTTEYTYNTDGSLTKDDNKGISSITYNVLGKPQSMTFSDGRSVSYTYDAVGNKLKTTTTVSGATTSTDYAGGFVYNTANSVTALAFFASPEGRVVKNGGNYEYQYAISDHQGNTRVVFTSAAPTTQSVNAGFETANQTTEASKFLNYQTGAHINTQATNANTGSNSLYLNGGYSGQVGVTKSYAVFPGDKLQIQAYARYNAPTSTPGNLTGFALALINAFNMTTPPVGETGTPASAINAWGGIEANGYGDGSTDNTDPRVFVTIVLFDKNHKFLDVTFDQLKTSGALMNASYTVKEAGFAYLYVSNENANLVDVYFDDVTMSYTPTNIIQSSEYYAHSMPTASSWTRDNTTNNFLGNGGTELNATTQLYDLAYRNYDATLGRFHQVDPLASQFASHTPYNYAFNNPVMMNDPLGDKPQVEITFDIQNIPRPNCLDRSDNYDTGGGYSGSGSGPSGVGPYGASFVNNGDGTFRKTLFTSYDQAFAAGAAYNFKHKSWDQTAYGSYFGSVVSYYGSTHYGVLLSPTQVKGAIFEVMHRRIQQAGIPLAGVSKDKLDWTLTQSDPTYRLVMNTPNVLIFVESVKATKTLTIERSVGTIFDDKGNIVDQFGQVRIVGQYMLSGSPARDMVLPDEITPGMQDIIDGAAIFHGADPGSESVTSKYFGLMIEYNWNTKGPLWDPFYRPQPRLQTGAPHR